MGPVRYIYVFVCPENKGLKLRAGGGGRGKITAFANMDENESRYVW